MQRELGPDWGPYEHDSWAGLELHAQDELSHHGAEIALLRDLYRRPARRTRTGRAPDQPAYGLAEIRVTLRVLPVGVL
jgi:hypothetical protein